jgi:DNA-binding transcriptional MerR regulator
MAPNGDARLFGGGIPTAAPHRSIGEVLALLKDEFPDITISKIRFLESQGLLDPERTPSGYRRFYDKDVERLRWILRQQRENFLPLKVIKGRLAEGALADDTDDTDDADAPRDARTPDAPRPDAPREGTNGPQPATAATAEPAEPEPLAAPDIAEPPAAAAPPAPAAAVPSAPEAAATPERAAVPVPGTHPESPARRVLPEPALFTHRAVASEPSAFSRHAGDTSVSLTVDELAAATGLTPDDIADLERFDLLEHRSLGTTKVYDDEALLVARMAALLRAHGVEPRHLRMYKIAADREAGAYEQVVAPILRHRDPDARRRANDTLEELARLGEGMHAAMLRRALKHLT